jgi:hypothetical protein
MERIQSNRVCNIVNYAGVGIIVGFNVLAVLLMRIHTLSIVYNSMLAKWRAIISSFQ